MMGFSSEEGSPVLPFLRTQTNMHRLSLRASGLTLLFRVRYLATFDRVGPGSIHFHRIIADVEIAI